MLDCQFGVPVYPYPYAILRAMQSVCILGRQPALGIAELESLYGSSAVQPAGVQAALLAVDPDEVDFSRLGGSLKFGQVLGVLDTTLWKDIEKYLIKELPKLAETGEGKLTIGISAYGLKVSPAAIGATGLSLKKVIRKSGRSVRLVPNKELELNTAQVLHNKLTGSSGWELLLIRDDNRTILARTLAIQDIESYTVRDRGRPKRDARVGMLPPKLAQIIINLAVDGHKPATDFHVLDPFCGTGVVLQEAMLMGFNTYGDDIEKRMIDYTYANLEWLRDTLNVHEPTSLLNVGDATTTTYAENIGAVACETYLGRPFTSLPVPEVLHQTVSECNLIIRKFLKNIGSQVRPGTRMCLAVPAWQVRPGRFKHLPLLDSLEELGYNRISFEHVRNEDLLYYRTDQVVARELLVIVKK